MHEALLFIAACCGIVVGIVVFAVLWRFVILPLLEWILPLT
jgi:hypothetical protein